MVASKTTSSPSLTAVKRLADNILDHLLSIPYADSRLAREISIDALQEIDDVLSLASSRLRSLRNTLSPVNTLPPEVLTTIFGTLSTPNVIPPTSLSPAIIPSKAKPRAWLPVTHVCRYWRDTALGYPFLWSPIVFEPADLRNEDSLPYECLHRSLGAPLDVQIKCGESTDTQVWNRLAARCGRLRKFQIIDLLDPSNLKIFNGEALILRSLQIGVSNRLIERRDFGDSEDEAVSDELPLLFSGRIPTLRHLTLSFFTRYSSNHFESLTELRLSDQLYASMADISHLIALLEASPNLEELSLTKCDISALEDELFLAASPVKERFLSMYRLQRLAFVDCHANLITHILGRLELSNDNTAVLCRGWQPAERSLTSIFPPKHRSRLYPLSNITTIDLSYDTSQIIASSPSTAVYLVFDNDLDVADEIAPSLPLVFPFQTLRELRLSGIELRTADFWQQFFGSMVALHKLVLWLPPTNSDKWLTSLTSENLSGRPYPAPVLSELCLFPPYPQIWDNVTSLAESRSRDSHRLTTLRVMCETGTRDAAIRRAFDGWKANSAGLEGIVDEVIFEAVSKYRDPVKNVPEVHRMFLFPHPNS